MYISANKYDILYRGIHKSILHICPSISAVPRVVGLIPREDLVAQDSVVRLAGMKLSD